MDPIAEDDDLKKKGLLLFFEIDGLMRGECRFLTKYGLSACFRQATIFAFLDSHVTDML